MIQEAGSGNDLGAASLQVVELDSTCLLPVVFVTTRLGGCRSAGRSAGLFVLEKSGVSGRTVTAHGGGGGWQTKCAPLPAFSKSKVRPAATLRRQRAAARSDRARRYTMALYFELQQQQQPTTAVDQGSHATPAACHTSREREGRASATRRLISQLKWCCCC